jgi:hypothetical protein
VPSFADVGEAETRKLSNASHNLIGKRTVDGFTCPSDEIPIAEMWPD